ncbi:hypothetical protein BS47DRAFT_1200377 [Hydnum rufescens UP504]|uniref:histidinol-phosphate transaminase n=1 Tax=Hydnum rufescens UP504 TaxID=1448309 RepID=A0A9P6DQH0_9AGAM|nr:hypothetical protein BS47DRAFT_1200377 [Hydnum rufescens UP504]
MPIKGLAPEKISSHPPHFDIEAVIRPNILALEPYRCARDDYSSGILLDANENSLGHSIPRESQTGDLDLDQPLHRYPDPSHDQIKAQIANLRDIPGTDHVFLGVGSDEVIDLLIRVCCVPGKDKILTTPPTYGMYAVTANINDVGIVKVPLDATGGAFQPQVDQIRKAVASDASIKIIFLCSPGNPTGTLIPLSTITSILEEPSFKGIVAVDEAYVDFSPNGSSAASLVHKYGNLVVMQTLSKSFGLAAIRLGIAIAQPPLIQVLSNTKAPYNISTPTASLALRALSPQGLALMREKLQALLASRAKLIPLLESLKPLGVGSVVGGNDANFVLLPILARAGGEPDNDRAQNIYKTLAGERGVVVRYRGSELGCAGCLRVTVGTAEENAVLLGELERLLRLTLLSPTPIGQT